MFSMGGMTLGYFTRVPMTDEMFEADDKQDAAKTKTPVPDEDEKRQDFEKAFLTPWHLFF